MLAVIAGVAASAIAFAASTGLGVFWPLAWLAPVPVLVLAFCRPRRSAALLAFLAYFLGNLSLLRLFRTGGLIIFAGPPSIAFAIAVLAARAAIGRMPPWQAALVFPSVFTAYEFLYSSISLNGTYWSVGYSQTDVLPLLQIVSLTGLWGVIFLMTFLPSAMAVAWHRRTAWVLTPALGSLLVALGFGAVRLWRAPDSVSVRAGVFAADQVVPVADGSDVTPTVRLARAYAAGIARMASERAEIVVMPEKLVGMSPEDTEAVTRVFSDASRAARVTAIVGLSRMGATQRHNVAVVFGPGGEMVAEYEKHHLVPLIESDFASGDTPRLFSGPGAQWGVAICKDLDFPGWSREYGRRGVRLLAVPALDFVRDGRMHSRMALTRGVENGFAVARAAGQGVVTLSDAYGRVLGEESSAMSPEARVVRLITAGPGATFYTRYGDWFGWADVLLAGSLLVVIAFRRQPAGRERIT